MTRIDESKSIDFYNSRPGIRVSGGVLIFNLEGSLLLVKPDYRNTWSWPGGGRGEGESPLTAAARECKEEIGLCPTPLSLAFMNYVPPRPDGSKDILFFAYTADPVSENFIHKVTLQENEIEDARFVPIAELHTYMKPYRVTAIKTYLKHRAQKTMLYLEDGELLQS